MVVRHFHPAYIREIKALLMRAMRAGHWLVLLCAHVSAAHLSLLLDMLAGLEYLVSGHDVTFRLFLAVPHHAVENMRHTSLHQCVQVVLDGSPVTPVSSSVRGCMQLLAHPLTSYIAFYEKGADREMHYCVLGMALAMAALSRLLATAGAACNSSSLGWWDFLHGTHLLKLIIHESKR